MMKIANPLFTLFHLWYAKTAICSLAKERTTVRYIHIPYYNRFTVVLEVSVVAFATFEGLAVVVASAAEVAVVGVAEEHHQAVVVSAAVL